MIKNNNNSFSSVYDVKTVIGKIYKGTLKVYEVLRSINLCNPVEDNMLVYRSDYAKFTVENGKVITTGNTLAGFIVPVKPNKTYSFGYKLLRKEASYVTLRLREYDTVDKGFADGNVVQSFNQQFNKDGQCSGTITTLETTKYVLLTFYTTGSAEIYDFMANDGDTLLDYVPYV